ncbi:MAG: DUF72 domain-containing protein [Vicinamibacterales bacterium]
MPPLVGTSGWSYPSGRGTWNGIFYPAPRRKGFDELAYYAERFDTVEVNSTFYRVPDPGLVLSWVRRTPATFGFSVKLYQKFTHPDMYLQRRGASEWDVTRGDLDEFRRGIDPMAQAGRLSALLIQFPASFQAEPDTLAYVDWLVGALGDYPIAVELRHKSWSDAATTTRAVLDAHHAAWVVIDEPKFATSIRQDLETVRVSAPTTTPSSAPLAYFRLHGRNFAQWWDHEESDDRYNYLYAPTELAPFAEAAQAAAVRHRKVLMYMNNHFSAKAVANAVILRHQLGDLLPGEYDREMVARYPELAGIVRTENRLI